MIYKKKSIYKDVVQGNGKCVPAKKYVDHSHDHQEEHFKEMNVVDVAGSLCGERSAISTIRKAFERNCESFQSDAKNISFPKIRRGLQYIVSKHYISSPSDCVQVIEAFQLEHVWTTFGITKDEAKPEHFFSACIEEGDVSYCIFSSKKTMTLIEENISPTNRTYLMDATFSSVPRGCFRQHLIIYVQYFEEIFPIFFVLMNKKSFAAYAHLLEYINENIFQMQPNTFITDYEQSMRNSVQQKFPDVKLVGCWFHYCQAIRRYVSKNQPLRQYIKSSKPAMVEYKKIMALPLLSSSLICGAFKDIKSRILLMDGDVKFGQFLSYYEKQWLKKVGYHNMSVYKQSIRTTSAVEAYNGVIGKLVEKNSKFFKFVQAIRKEEFFKSRHFQMLCDSGSSAKKRKRRSSKEALIVEATLLLDESKITVAKFLERIVHESNAICSDSLVKENNDYDLDAIENNNEEDENWEEVENVSTNNTRVCVVCQEKAPNVVLLPCKHLILCDECNLKLQAAAIENNERSYNCPYCREFVHDIMQVFI